MANREGQNLVGSEANWGRSPSDNRFGNLTYHEFRRLARDQSLSCYEKIGFPNSYREGQEEAILQDICGKLAALSRTNQTVLDIGPGCSHLAEMLIELCGRQGHTLFLIDSPEMLGHLPDRPYIRKLPSRFPDCGGFLEENANRLNCILAYSVAHYPFAEGSIFEFVDRALSLLAPGGEMLIGDIPNISKRKRFFSSAAGVQYHQQFVGRVEVPSVAFNQPEPGHLDDAVILALLFRARLAGFDSYLLPQGVDLPLANRREDLLIRRP
jgi:hypothetical protein